MTTKEKYFFTPGYVTNQEGGAGFRGTKEAQIECIPDEVRGSFWAHAGTRERALCIRGCTDKSECRMDEVCDEVEHRCAKITCQRPDEQRLNGKLQ